MSISELVIKYLAEIKNIRRYSDNTIKSYKTDLDEFSNYCQKNGKTELLLINEKIIKSYLMLLSEKSLDKKSIARKLAAIRSTFKYAFQNDLINENPVSFVSNPKSHRKLPEVVSTNNILEIYKIAEESEEKPELIKVVFELLYGCALRVSELCDLKYSSVDFNKSQLRVTGKGDKMRIVPIGEKSLEILNEYIIKNPIISYNDYLIRTKKMINFTRD